MAKGWNADLYACGQEGLPGEIVIGNRPYHHVRTFKHDFFAATGYYESESKTDGTPSESSQPVVLKVNRQRPFLGIPLKWLGRGLCKREIELLQHLQTIDQVPKLIGPWGSNGLLYKYIDGRSLDEKPPIPDSFFDELKELLDRIHEKQVCYVDLNKRGNILMGKDGRPYLIDFQISLHCKRNGWLSRLLQREDRYHLLKHKRRLRRDLMSHEELEESYRKSFWIHVHRAVASPFRFLRRLIMRWLYTHDYLNSDPNACHSPENDPKRFAH